MTTAQKKRRKKKNKKKKQTEELDPVVLEKQADLRDEEVRAAALADNKKRRMTPLMDKIGRSL